MRSTEEINKNIEEYRKQLKSNRISDSDKQTLRDKLKELYNELNSKSINIEQKVVPVETNNIIAHRENEPNSRFISSNAFRI